MSDRLRSRGHDRVRVTDQLQFAFAERADGVLSPMKKVICGPDEKEIVQVEGFFSAVCRERGKLVYGTRREGKNIWTLTGREFLAQLMSYSFYGTAAHGSGSPNPDLPTRDDRIRYFGFGIGTQPEVSSVTALVTPITFDGGGTYLAQVALPTYPLAPSRSTVEYGRTYTELELSFAGTVNLTEAGLFTDGDSGANYAPRTRDTSLANAAAQAPAAYKSFEPLKKTQNFVLDVSWQIRF
jgi:hypothetical protein